jgi:probable F420-dependent oxidoreductase
MKVGITLPQFGAKATKENVIWLARMAEEEHFDSLWVNERLLWPLNPRTLANSPDGNLPTYYQNVLDPLETLTFAAANTDRIALGTSVIDMLFHNPVILARRFATLDVLSNGRSICGLGIGWSEDEYIASNIPYEHRAARADEFVQALTRIWTQDIVEFKGRYYEIPASKIGPKPIQRPRIPIYLAGFSPNTFSRVVKYADGWLPSADRLDFFEHLTNGIKTLKEQGKKEKRNLEIITLTFPFHADSHKEDGTPRPPFGGTVDDVRDDLRRIKEMGVDHAILQLTEPDLNQVIDTAKQVSKFAK